MGSEELPSHVIGHLIAIETASCMWMSRQSVRCLPGQGGGGACTANATYGGLFFERRPHIWITRECRGVFDCAVRRHEGMNGEPARWHRLPAPKE